MFVDVLSLNLLAPLDPVIRLAYQGLTAVAAALHPLAGGASAALAVIVCTMAIRAALSPLSRAQLRGMRAQAALAPQVAKLRTRHAADRQRLQREVSALYQREGVSPLGGCLPALVQAPFFMVLYRLASSPVIGGHANVLLDNTLFGMPLGGHLLAALSGPIGAPVLIFGVLLALVAGVALWSSRTTPPGMPVSTLQRIMPFGTLVAIAVVPFAAGLYVLTSTTWATAERAWMYRTMAHTA